MDEPENDQLNDEQQAEETQEQAPEFTEHEQLAMANGWMSKEKWEEAGKDPLEWETAKSHNKYGELLNTVKDLQKTTSESEAQFDARLNGVNKIHEAQLSQQLAALKDKQKQNVENADTDSYNNTQEQIDKLTQAAQQPVIPPNVNEHNQVVANWNAANPWASDGTPKAAFAISEFNRIQAQGVTGQAAINAMESSVNKHFPDVNHRRNGVSQSEPPRKSNTSKPKKLTMANVTPQEMKLRSSIAEWSDPEVFLQAIEDSRA